MIPDVPEWLPWILALVIGALAYWKLSSACDWVVAKTWNKLPFVEDTSCSKAKWTKWVLAIVAVLSALASLKLTSRLQDLSIQY